jgi:hypothetical protein
MSLRHRMLAIIARYRFLFAIAATPYRPELHYMRGPGPKWRAKQRLAD